MPLGYDFICENKDCKGYQGRLTLSGPWPLVLIDELLGTKKVQADPDLKDGLEKRRRSGRKLACAIMPNEDMLDYRGARVQMFCPTDLIIWDEDFIGFSFRDPLPTMERKCSRCQGELITMEMARDNGLNCPHCQQTMQPNMWFTNE